MACCLKIIGLFNGEPTPFDGRYVRQYDPTFVEADGSYDGGILEVSDHRENAIHFPSVKEALA
jgi:hypothetical protein